MDDVYENIDDYNPSKKRKILIAFDDIIADIMKNKRFQAIIKEFFIRCRKLFIRLWPIILQILITNILWRLTGNAQESSILFWQLILPYLWVIS